MKRLPFVETARRHMWSTSALLAFALTAVMVAGRAHGDDGTGGRQGVNDPLLDKLVGRWRVEGTIHGKPIDQRLDASWVLAHRFVRLHFTTASGPPASVGVPYEAEMFIGWDDKQKRYVAHWLDVFGGPYSEPVGHGAKMTPDAFVIEFPYPEGTFRDTFTWSRGTWSLLIEAQDGSRWTTFANEKLITTTTVR
jgi:hypothetical protein